MPENASKLFQRVGATIDYGVAYALGTLANLAYYPDTNFDDTWAEYFGFTDSQTVITPGPELPNYTRVRGTEGCIFAIAGTTNVGQMIDNVMYSGQVEDLDFGAGRIHSFFRWVAAGLIPHIDADLAGRPTSTKLTFTGHSLGGAAAHLLAWYYSLKGYHVQNCVVFNSPMVGDAHFAGLSRPFGYWHVCNYLDMVSGLPTPWTLEITNGFPLYGLIANSWAQTRPIHYVWVNPAPDISIATLPAARVPEWQSYRQFLEEARRLGEWPTGRRIAARNTINRFLTRFGLPAVAVAAFSLFTIKNHEMTPLLGGLLEHFREAPGELTLTDVIALQRHLAANPIENPDLTPFPRDVGLVDPTPFLSSTPPASPAATPPATPAGTRLEATTVTGGVTAAPRNTAPAAALNISHSILPPGVVLPPSLTSRSSDWFFKGQDRRLLEQLQKNLRRIDDRDALRMAPGPSSRISTREPIIDPDDEDLQDAFAVVNDQIDYLLSLEKE